MQSGPKPLPFHEHTHAPSSTAASPDTASSSSSSSSSIRAAPKLFLCAMHAAMRRPPDEPAAPPAAPRVPHPDTPHSTTVTGFLSSFLLLSLVCCWLPGGAIPVSSHCDSAACTWRQCVNAVGCGYD
eukprot:353532-Chlamydomonas_euryale.AAC.1